MSRSRGKIYDDVPKLNVKKVFATIIAIVVVIMIIISFRTLLTPTQNLTKDVSTITTYFPVYSCWIKL